MTDSPTRVRPLDPRLLRHARAARGYVGLTAALGITTAALIVVQAELLADVIARTAMQPLTAMQHGTLAEAVPEALGLGAVLLARTGVSWAQERYGLRAAGAVIAQLRARVLDRLAQEGPQALASGAGPGLTTLVTVGLDALQGYLTRYLPQLLLAATVTPGVLVVVLAQDWRSAATMAVTLPLVPVFMALVGLSTQQFAARRLRTMRRLGGQVLDLLAGLPTLRALGREQGQARRVREVGEAYRAATMRTLRSAFLSALVLESLTTLSVALVAVGIGLRLLAGDLDLRTGLAVLILAPEVFLPLRLVGVHYHASVDGLAAASEAFAVLDRPLVPAGSAPAPDLSTGTVLLHEVTVCHPGRGRSTPHELTLAVRPGEVVALAGASGTGKSSAVSVLLGLRRPDAGAVLWIPDPGQGPDGAPDDGDPAGTVDLADVDPAGWRAQFTWVPQRPVLVPGSVLTNVLLGRDGDPLTAYSPTLAAAARASGLDEVLATLPQGWDTVIGSGGLGLSAGQRQRVALTRALLRPAAVVVLDEPTAHLDAGAEARVLDTVAALRARGSAVLLVAHRPSLLAIADRVVVAQDGPPPSPVALAEAGVSR